MKPLNICMILPQDFPTEPRVEREACALHQQGHTVHLLCNNTRGLPLEENLPHFTIHRLTVPPGPFRKFAKLYNMPLFLNPRWIIKSLRIILKSRAHVIHVHDLPLAPIGIFFAKILRKKLVMDFHENYPALLKQIYRGTVFDFIFKNPVFAAALERLCVRSADRLLVVVEEHTAKFEKMGFPQNRLSIVGNGEDVDFPRAEKELENLRRTMPASNANDIVFAGGFEPLRGLDTLIRAFVPIPDEFPRSRLILAGAGPLDAELRKLVRELGMQQKIIFTGWVEPEKMYEIISSSYIGVVPHVKCELVDTTVPHKLFHYMGKGKPVVVTDAVPLKRVVSGESCGIVVPSGDTHGMTEAFRKLLSDRELGHRLGINGLQAVLRKYNWQAESEELIRAYDSLCDAGQRG